MSTLGKAGAGLGIGLIAAIVLWKYWTGICNEACPAGVSIAMIAYCVALPFVAGGVGLLTARLVDRRRRAIFYAIVLTVLAAIAVALSTMVQ